MTSPYVLEITLPGLPRTTNRLNVHWRVRQTNTKKWQNAVILEARRKGTPLAPLERAQLTLTRYSAKECDFDNLVSSFKPLIDGLRIAGVIKDDKQSVIGQSIYLQGVAKRNKGFITMKVEEVAA